MFSKPENFNILYLPAILYFVGLILLSVFQKAGFLMGLYLIPWIYFFGNIFNETSYIILFLFLNLSVLILAAFLTQKYATVRLKKFFEILFMVISVGQAIWLLNLVLIILMSIFSSGRSA